jgi:hypothetical protein
MPHPTLYAWLRKGCLTARHDQGTGQWVIRADAGDGQRLQALRQAPRLWQRPPPPTGSEGHIPPEGTGQAG